jgi:hypothetical protein
LGLCLFLVELTQSSHFGTWILNQPPVIAAVPVQVKAHTGKSAIARRFDWLFDVLIRLVGCWVVVVSFWNWPELSIWGMEIALTTGRRTYTRSSRNGYH